MLGKAQKVKEIKMKQNQRQLSSKRKSKEKVPR